MSDPRINKLKIMTGVVKRCGKEKLSYRKEADMQKSKVEQMKTDGKEEIAIRKMNECVQETLMMIPDCHRRLDKAVRELTDLLAQLDSVDELKECPELEAAREVLLLAEDQLKAE